MALKQALDFVLETSRFLLAAVFLTSSAGKFFDPAGARRALRDFGVPKSLASPLLVLLLVAEISVAALFFTTTLVWYAAWGALGLLTIFVLAVLVAIVRGRHPDCHCFGQIHSEPAGWPIIARNVLFGACAAALIHSGPSYRSADLYVWYMALGPTASKFAWVGAGAAGFLILRLAHRPEPQITEPEIDEDSWQWTDLLSTGLLGDQLSFETEPDSKPVAAARPPAQRRPAQPRPVAAPAPAEPSYIETTGIGLPIGTPAPDFDLPSLTGGRHTLQSLGTPGKELLLVFLSPFCRSCMAVVPGLARWVKEQPEPPNFAIISVGKPEENLAKLQDFDPARILLQKQLEVAKAYDSTMTPTALWIDSSGKIRTLVATGGPEIKRLLYPA